MISTHLIKPLLFATEKVFEQIIAVPTPHNPTEDQNMLEPVGESEQRQESSTSEFSLVKAQLMQLNLDPSQPSQSPEIAH